MSSNNNDNSRPLLSPASDTSAVSAARLSSSLPTATTSPHAHTATPASDTFDDLDFAYHSYTNADDTTDMSDTGGAPPPPAATVRTSVAQSPQRGSGSAAAASSGGGRRRGLRRIPSEVERWEFGGFGRTQTMSVSTSAASPPPARASERSSLLGVPPLGHFEEPASPGLPGSRINSPRRKGTTGVMVPDRAGEVLLEHGSPETALDDLTSYQNGGGGGGPGRRRTLTSSSAQSVAVDTEAHKLGQFTATAISGNDILSSCLYTAGLCGAAAGVYAPVSMLMVVIMLYLFRGIYGEVGTALPLNGGAYNALLNATTKATAAVAAALTILSYVATGVVSAAEACNYLQTTWHELDTYWATILLLFFFGVLSFLGITESAVVALCIFTMHVLVLVILVVASINKAHDMGFDLLRDNYYNTVQPATSKALLYGFSAASLGITGFETSSNYIEEQREGVFPKTLRNMWIGTLIFNPTLSFLSVVILPLDDMFAHQNTLLSRMAHVSAGPWLEHVVAVDAFLVLAGSVLTSYVGVTGLVKRLAGDRCLPEVLLTTNKWRGTTHWITILFFLVCTSLFAIVDAKVETLSSVYSISFLCVMALFAVGDMMLKYKRDHLPRPIRAWWPAVVTGFLLVMLALGITIVRKPVNLQYFVMYFGATALLFSISFFRVRMLKILLYFGRRVLRDTKYAKRFERFVTKTLRRIGRQSVVFFARTTKRSVINKAVLYIRENEDARWVRVVHCCPSEEDVPPNFVENVKIVDSLYPKIRVDSVICHGEFSPETVDFVAREFKIPKNMLFITCPSKNFSHRIAELGGVRVITRWNREGKE